MRIKSIMLGFAAVAAFSAASAYANTVNLVVNGDFEQTTNGAQQFDEHTKAVGWTSDGYNFLFAADSADTSGSSGISLWGPKNGAPNGLTNSPTGGNFAAADGAYQVGPIWQIITGLTAGQQYNVSFDWAGAQQHGFDGLNTEQWIVSLGDQTQSTAVYNNASHGFSGWMHETFTFTASKSSEVLSFLAHGTPEGVPPFSLLDGVTMVSAVPEPETWAMMLGGFGLIGFVARRRRNGAAA